MTKVRNQQAYQEDPPDFEIVGSSEDERFVDGEDEVQVCQLQEGNVLAGAYALGEGQWWDDESVLEYFRGRQPQSRTRDLVTGKWEMW